MRGHERHTRSIVKTVSWRLIATLVSLSVVYAFTGKIIQSVTITLVAGSISTLAYYAHERVWNAIRWGKH